LVGEAFPGPFRSSGKCDRENLPGYAFFSSVKVLSDSKICESNDHLQVKQGSLSAQYSYNLNDSIESSMSLNVKQGQCLGF